jgi:microcystin-dependent protein
VVNPRTVNLGIIVPLTGADVDLWGEDDVNPNMVSFDGFIGGVQTISLTTGPVTLTAPAGFTATPSPGPTEAENRVLRFTGTLTGDVLVTLPLPGVYVVENRTVQGVNGYVVQLRGAVASTEIVALPYGSTVSIFNDGSNVRFFDMGKVGDMEFWAGVSSLPRWVSSCVVAPYLICDGLVATYNFSDFPQLGARLGASFGGNGITTFGVPDQAGRVPLAYDRTGTRVTVADGGINGQTLGAAGGLSYSQLVTANLPAYTPSGTNTGGASNFQYSSNSANWGSGSNNTITAILNSGGSAVMLTNFTQPTFTGVAQGGTSTKFTNLMPTQVVGIWVIKT